MRLRFSADRILFQSTKLKIMRIKLLLISLFCSLILATIVTFIQRDPVSIVWHRDGQPFICLRDRAELDPINFSDPTEFIFYPSPMSQAFSPPTKSQSQGSQPVDREGISPLPMSDYSLRDFQMNFYRYLLRSLLIERAISTEDDWSFSH